MIVLKATAPRAPEQADIVVEKVDRRRQPRSLEVRAKISATMKGRPVSMQSRVKISATMKLKGIRPPEWRGGRKNKAGIALVLLRLTPS